MAIIELIETLLILKVGISIDAIKELHLIKVFLIIVTVFTLKCGIGKSASAAFWLYCTVLALDIALYIIVITNTLQNKYE